MRPETLSLIQTNRAVQLGIAAAVILALVGIAKLVGSHSSKPVVTLQPKGAAVAAAQARPATELSLEGPLMPHYSAPQPPAVGPTVPDQPQAPAAVVAEGLAAVAQRDAPMPMPEPLPQPQAPRFGPVAPGAVAAPTPAPASTSCPYCGEVIALTVWPDMAEVRVRFQDGSTRMVRTPMPTRWRVGDHVRAEDGRLVAD